jgi:hypothetical protein
MNFRYLFMTCVGALSLCLFLPTKSYAGGCNSGLGKLDPTCPGRIFNKSGSSSKPTIAIPDGYEMRDGDWSSFPRPVVSKDFSETERNIIWQSLGIASTRMRDSQVMSCVKKYVTKDYSGSDPQDKVRSIGTHLKLVKRSVFRIPERQYLYISKINIPEASDGGYTLGKAILNIGVDKNDLRVDLNRGC